MVSTLILAYHYIKVTQKVMCLSMVLPVPSECSPCAPDPLAKRGVANGQWLTGSRS